MTTNKQCIHWPVSVIRVTPNEIHQLLEENLWFRERIADQIYYDVLDKRLYFIKLTKVLKQFQISFKFRDWKLIHSQCEPVFPTKNRFIGNFVRYPFSKNNNQYLQDLIHSQLNEKLFIKFIDKFIKTCTNVSRPHYFHNLITTNKTAFMKYFDLRMQ
jgi:hypothetical protein